MIPAHRSAFRILVAALGLFLCSCQVEPAILTATDSGKVLDQREQEILAAHPDRAMRQDVHLTLRIGPDLQHPDTTRVFEDKSACDSYEECIFDRLIQLDSATATAIIYEQYYEGHSAILLDLDSGGSIDLDDVPHISPTGEFWIAADTDIGYGSGSIQLIARDGKGFRILATDFTHGFCAFVRWRDAHNVSLNCPVTRDDGVDFDDIREVEITRSAAGAWSETESTQKISYDDYLRAAGGLP